MSKWYASSKPEEIQPMPWLGQKVIKHIESILEKDFEVIEHGAGGSTLWFAERVRKVVSIENNEDWKKVIEDRKIPNIYIYSKIDFNLPKFQSFDIVFIDGEPVEDRRLWIVNSIKFINTKGYVILDNANRPEYEAERSYLHSVSKSIQTFNSNDGTKYLVTDICRIEK